MLTESSYVSVHLNLFACSDHAQSKWFWSIYR